MKREKVYIAGKITGLDRNTVEFNFNRWKNRLILLGYEVVSPIDIVDETTPWNEAMYICLFHLSKCDKVLFMDNWTQSKGASIEMEFTIYHNIPILSRGLIESAYVHKIKHTKGY